MRKVACIVLIIAMTIFTIGLWFVALPLELWLMTTLFPTVTPLEFIKAFLWLGLWAATLFAAMGLSSLLADIFMNIGGDK